MRAQKTERFETALADLSAHVEAQGFEVRGGFYAWDRMKVLVGRLQRALDYWELEGDAAPVRDELGAYRADLGNMGLKPDAWVVGRLNQLVAELEAPTSLVELEVRVAGVPGGDWPATLLAVHPDELERLLRARAQGGRLTGA
jgi:hypothetical protein